MNRVYKIEFNKSSFELDKDYERFSEQEKLAISSMNPDSFFDFNDKERYTLYLIFSPLDIEKYSKILDNNLIEHTTEDVSERVLDNKLCVESSLKPFVNALNRFRWNTYKAKLDQWIYDNLDMDLVLDRIGQCGMDGLRPVEKKFLRNFQN
jgi:hypothetical protein